MGSIGKGTSRSQNVNSAPPPVVYTQLSDADETALLSQQNFSKKTLKALDDYVDPKQVRGTLYSKSQNLNYKMENGLQLTKREQTMLDGMMDGMHNLGKNLLLTHFGRVSMVDGIGNAIGASFLNSRSFENLSDSQLASLKGKSFSLDQLVSASYNGFKNAPNKGAPFTDKAVEIEIKAPSTAKGLFTGDKGAGGKSGEVVLAPAQNYRIVNVTYPGGLGRSGSRRYKKIKFEVEMY